MFDFIEVLEQAKTMLSVQQVADMMGVHHQTVRTWIKNKSIPSVRIGGQRLFDPKTLYWWYTKKNPDALKARIALSS